MGKVYLGLHVKTTSRREPYKAIRLIDGRPLFLYCLERFRYYIKADGEFLITTQRPADDLLAFYFEEKGIPVVRCPLNNYRDAHGDIHFRVACKQFGFADDDIILVISVDRPFCYLEDIMYRIKLLQASDAETVITAPNLDIFPAHDWEWAVCPTTINKVSFYRNPVQRILSESRLDYTARYFPEFAKNINLSGAVPILFIRKTREAAAPWPYQPLWIDEPGQFEKAKLILETLGMSPPPSAKAVRALLESRHDILLMAASAPRRSINGFAEDKDWIRILSELIEEIGSAPAMDEVHG